MNLSARIGWCMTGTPIQNSIDDLGSLLKFLRVPFLEDTTSFRKHIIGQTAVAGAISRQGLDNLRLLLGVICIRRSASATDMATHDVIHKEIRVELTSAERTEYTAIGKFMKESLDAAVSSPNSKGASQAILRGILRLRQFCNNGNGKICPALDSAYALDEKVSILEQGSETACALCQTSMLVNGQFDLMDLPHLTQCDALICGNCLPKLPPQTAVVGISVPTLCIICGTSHDNINYLTEGSQAILNQSSKDFWEAKTSKLSALARDITENHIQEKRWALHTWKPPIFAEG
jgi:SWI/SNF-related matrix-associated actin-dependent regulator of chromatin subfamily A3